MKNLFVVQYCDPNSYHSTSVFKGVYTTLTAAIDSWPKKPGYEVGYRVIEVVPNSNIHINEWDARELVKSK